MKTSLFKACSIQHCEPIRDAKLNNVNILEDRIKEHLQDNFQSKIVKYFENRRKNASPPPLNPPMLTGIWQQYKDFFIPTKCKCPAPDVMIAWKGLPHEGRDAHQKNNVNYTSKGDQSGCGLSST